MSSPERMKEVVDICLKTFMEKGLSNTSTRDLCEALNLNTGGIFWYFKTKDDIIIACAEEATIRIENELMGVALKEINNPDKLEKALRSRVKDLRPLMRFFVSVCALDKYEEELKPMLEKVSERYAIYTQKFAEKLNCETQEVAPFVYIVIDSMLSYMLFGKSNFAAPQLKLAKDALIEILKRNNNK